MKLKQDQSIHLLGKPYTVKHVGFLGQINEEVYILEGWGLPNQCVTESELDDFMADGVLK